MGGSVNVGGSVTQTECNRQQDCAPNQICVQVMFPIMPPAGFGGMSTGNAKFGVCRDPGAGGATNTGGAASSGGTSSIPKTNTGGKTTKPPVTGGWAGTGGATSRTPCNVTTGAECLANETCVQVIFPILPATGYDGGMGDVKLGECVAAKHSSNATEQNWSADDANDWWETAEAALRHS